MRAHNAEFFTNNLQNMAGILHLTIFYLTAPRGGSFRAFGWLAAHGSELCSCIPWSWQRRALHGGGTTNCLTGRAEPHMLAWW